MLDFSPVLPGIITGVATAVTLSLIYGGVRLVKGRPRKRWELAQAPSGAWTLKWRGPNMAVRAGWRSPEPDVVLHYEPLRDLTAGETCPLEGEVRRRTEFSVQWIDSKQRLATVFVTETGDRFRLKTQS